jgi:hypothetical protein
VRKIRAELARIGGNLNQAVRMLRMNPYEENIVTADLLAELQKAVKQERQILQATLLQNKASWARVRHGKA